jgi:hypothetical protein
MYNVFNNWGLWLEFGLQKVEYDYRKAAYATVQNPI